MAGNRRNSIQAETAAIVGVAVFLLAWDVIERITGTEPKTAPPGTTFHAASRAGATLTPSDQPPGPDTH